MSSYRINVALTIVIVSLSTNLFSQNGYKNFKWGESLERVNNAVPDLESISPQITCFLVAFSYQNWQLFESSIPNPASQLDGTLSAYLSEKENMNFYFLDSKLFAVEITFGEERISEELEAKYGIAPSRVLTIIESSNEIKAWFNSKGRIITYCKHLSSPYQEEVVSYINPTIYNKVADQLKKERLLEIKANRKKID
jgi:hypothetical protein